jgi:hypothetical protein
MEELIEDIEQFCDDHDMTTTQFSKLAVGDGAFYHKIKHKGRVCQISTVDKVYGFMNEQDGAQND